MTGLDASGIQKIRKIYQDEGQIERYELFSKAHDFTGEALLTMGSEKLERFFELFVGLEDLLREFDAESAELLKNMESAILARIALKARKNKIDNTI